MSDKYEEICGMTEFPLSHQQRFILMAEKYVKERTGDMNTPFAIRIHDRIDTKIFEDAVNSAVERYDTLRIVLEKKGDEDIQKVLKEYHYTLDLKIAEGETKEERFQNAYKDAFETVCKCLSVYGGVLWRIYLYKIDEDDFLMVVNFHHVIVDGSAGEIINNYLRIAYESLAEGKEIPDDNSAGFIEFVLDEISFTETERGKKQLEYWKKELEGYEHIDLSPYGSDESVNMTALPFTIDKNKMEKIAEREKVSHFALTMMAYHIALSKLTGRLDTEIGFSCANRMKKKYFGTMGYLSRAVQNRLSFSENAALTDLIKSTFNKISENIASQQTSHYNDSSQFYLSYASDMGNVKKLEFNHKPCELIKINIPHTLSFLTIIAYDEKDVVRLIFAGDTKVFSVDFVTRLAGYINAVTEQFYEDPQLKYSDIKIEE